ncbi:MAG: type II toxin-antitoxin system PemK/MazF family toxin, partial [Actinobacteria bacterium]|nr:type II toxin-antitoxin system PemK/MazF family toxin [Actinomycetota bacterium]
MTASCGAGRAGATCEIRPVELHPARGAEAKKRRPAVIVSNDRANTTAERLGRGVVTVVPLTSNTA